jgi:hypothetical protein
MTPSDRQSIDLAALTETLLATLDTRSKDIVSRRYGISSGAGETLESIGQEYGITRERVRQIQSQARRSLRGHEADLAPVAQVFADIFDSHGGVMAEVHVVDLVNQRFGQSYPSTITGFYLDVLPPYQYISRDSHFAPHWRHPELVQPHVPTVVETAEAVLAAHNHPIPEEKLMAALKAALEESGHQVPDLHIRAQLTASKRIAKTTFGEWGLVNWSETNPRGVGDKAYAVMRRHGKPEHFTEITKLINAAGFDHKTANPQTVHNELIKDSRFVLVGRGLYGLAEWGYIPGTVADVIASLLSKAGKPLTRDEVIEKVMEQRHVKKNTILLGLQNHERFARTGEDRYTLR